MNSPMSSTVGFGMTLYLGTQIGDTFTGTTPPCSMIPPLIDGSQNSTSTGVTLSELAKRIGSGHTEPTFFDSLFSMSTAAFMWITICSTSGHWTRCSIRN